MNKIKLYSIAALAIGAAAFTSCTSDDDASTAMQINQIYLEDADGKTMDTKDRKVEFARLGQMLRIEGSGFSGLKRIYVNGYKTDFNNAMLTDNNIWVQLSSKTPVADAETSVRNKITLWKSDNNQYTYDFTIRAASPSVTKISNTLPQPGETVYVYGANLQETTSVTLPDGTVVTSILNDEDGEYYSFVMPEGVADVGGSLVSEGANGTAKSPAMFNERGAMILDFDGGGTQGGWSATYTSDDLVQDPLKTGRGNVVPVVPESEMPISNGAHGKGWFTAGNGVDDWTQFYDVIPAETPVEEIALQFDIYCPNVWQGSGYLEFTFQNNLSSYGWGSTETTNTTNISYPTAVCWVPWLTDDNKMQGYQTTGWVTITIPLSKVGKYQTEGKYTFADVVADRAAASYANFGMFLVNSDIKFSDDDIIETGAFNQMVYVDNWRLVPNKQFVISDFPDEE